MKIQDPFQKGNSLISGDGKYHGTEKHFVRKIGTSFKCKKKKLSADNIIPINILNRPSPIKEYRYNILERSSRLSLNRVRDSKGISTTFYSNLSHKTHDCYSI